MMNEKTVVYLGNANVYGMMKLSAKSLLYHSDVDKIYFLIDDDKFPCSLPDKIQCICIRNQKFFRNNCPNLNGFYSYITLLRSVLSKILTEDRVLLLDPDAVVCDSIDKLWDYDISDYYFAAVPETRASTHELQPYYNAGVMLMNLGKFRKDRMDDSMIVELNQQFYPHLEQDALNYLCHDHILELPSDFSTSFVTDETNHTVIRHCLSDDKHLFSKYAKQYSTMSWDDVMSRQNELKGG